MEWLIALKFCMGLTAASIECFSANLTDLPIKSRDDCIDFGKLFAEDFFNDATAQHPRQVITVTFKCSVVEREDDLLG